jgi:hypothetical protein
MQMFLPSCFSLIMELVNLAKAIVIWLQTLTSHSPDKDLQPHQGVVVN